MRSRDEFDDDVGRQRHEQLYLLRERHFSALVGDARGIHARDQRVPRVMAVDAKRDVIDARRYTAMHGVVRRARRRGRVDEMNHRSPVRV